MPWNRLQFTTFELILLTQFAVLLAVLNVVLNLPIHVPGHTGLYWAAILVIARGIVQRTGSATYVGSIGGILASFLGAGRGLLMNVPKFAAAGLAVDVVALLLIDLKHPVTGVVAGIFANLAKLLVGWALAVLIGVPVFFIAIGLTFTAVTHIIFGALGGILGSFVLIGLRRAGFFSYLEQRLPTEHRSGNERTR